MRKPQARIWTTIDECLDPPVLRRRIAGDSRRRPFGPEALPPQPFLDALAEYGAPHGVVELDA